jgi:hypothetical protein
VDFLVGDGIAIEVTASPMVSERHLSGLLKLSEKTPLRKRIIVSRDQNRRTLQGVEVLPYPLFIERLWSGELLS